MVFNTTFNNISAISWRSVLLVEETRVPKANHKNCIKLSLLNRKKSSKMFLAQTFKIACHVDMCTNNKTLRQGSSLKQPDMCNK